MTAPTPSTPDSELLSLFTPVVRDWFRDCVGTPSAIQRLAWPHIVKGENVLLSAPTGSGKTLTAFLHAIDALLDQRLTLGRLQVLYVSPLKALNHDIARNLLRPLEALRQRSAQSQGVRVAVRSGDSTAAERRAMLRHPPEILVTTPESLHLLLSSAPGRKMLADVAVLILDEVHAVFDSKRGSYLMLAVERLAELAGEFQRIAISATVKPAQRVADWVAGFTQEGAPRPLRVLRDASEKRLQLRVCHVPATPEPDEALSELLLERIRAQRATLIFVNNRKLCEKLAQALNQRAGNIIAYAHHGALSKELRHDVEKRLQRGELSAVVATSSLELGIDIGELDEVLHLDLPPSVNAAIQRIGRAGHQVGAVSYGRFYPRSDAKLLECAVMAPLVNSLQSETLRPVEEALDVLAPFLVNVLLAGPRSEDSLFALCRCCWPYRKLQRSHFALLLEMLCGRYAETRLPGLRALLERVEQEPTGSSTLRALPRARMALYSAGGVIPDRGYYTIRLKNGAATIGELDEEFVWERKVGDVFAIGTQTWRIEEIGAEAVYVSPTSRNAAVPFWRGESIDRDFSFFEKLGDFVEALSLRLDEPQSSSVGTRHDALGNSLIPQGQQSERQALTHAELVASLAESQALEPECSERLVTFLRRQRASTGALPHRHLIVAEHTRQAPSEPEKQGLILHLLWGSRINRTLAICLSAAYEEQFGSPLELLSTDTGICVSLPAPCSARELLDLVELERIAPLLRSRLEGTAIFGARFRENAARAMLIPKRQPRRRTPLWLSRLRSQALMAATRHYPAFPISLETWRQISTELLDLEGLKARLEELQSGLIAIHECSTSAPSPFSAELVYRSTNEAVYASDAAKHSGPSALSSSLLESLTHAQNRPRIPSAIIQSYDDKLAGIEPRYLPVDDEAWVELIDSRVFVDEEEFRRLCRAATLCTENAAPSARAGTAPATVFRIRYPQASMDIFATEPRILALCHGLSTSPRALTFEGASVDEDLMQSWETRLALRTGEGELSSAAKRTESPVPEPALVSNDLEKVWRDASVERDGPSLLRRLLLEALRCRGPRHPIYFCDCLGIEASALTALLQAEVEAQRLVFDVIEQPTKSKPGGGDSLRSKPEGCVPGMARNNSGEQAKCPMNKESVQDSFLCSRLSNEDSGESFGDSCALSEGETASDVQPAYCEASSLSRLLRLLRRSHRRDMSARHAEYNVVLCAALHGLGSRAEGVEELQHRLERLLLFPAPAAVWETELLPARMDYRSAELDSLLSDTALFWLGFGADAAAANSTQDPGKARDLLFCLRSEWSALGALVLQEGGEATAPTSTAVLPSDPALWEAVWSTRLTIDGFSALRNRLLSSRARPTPQRPGRWSAWSLRQDKELDAHPLPRLEPLSPLEAQEALKLRVKLLLRRYGVLFRERLHAELPGLRWGRIQQTLRLMEFSGELLVGRFFEGFSGPQYADASLENLLRDGVDENRVFWLSAIDPVSPCGLDTGATKPWEGRLPARLPSNHLVFAGSSLRMVSRRWGEHLEFFIGPEKQDVERCLELFRHGLGRRVAPRDLIRVKTINGENARSSPYAEALRAMGFLRDVKDLVLHR
ncbi:MAG: DEAD/DEAH box helicase [Myxococcota bacterium]|jgi:Lhr-like helicase|nr:DEAD/DEAH box helicase [Myxococcota bacterium]